MRSPKNVQDDFDRTLVERKLQRFEKKLQKCGKDHPEFSLIQKKIESYKKRLANESTVKADVRVLQDYLDTVTERSIPASVSTQTPTIFTPLSHATRSRKSRSTSPRHSGKDPVLPTSQHSTDDVVPTPASPNNHDSFTTLSTLCSPTELNESYISMDPFSPYAMPGSSAKRNQQQRSIPPPPLEQPAGTMNDEGDGENPSAELYCKVFQQHSSKEMVQVGFVVLNGSNPTFAHAREVILEELVPDMLSEDMVWKFVVPTLGKVSQKQEQLFGPLMNNTLADGGSSLGTLQHPFSLVIVPNEASSTTTKTPKGSRQDSESTIITKTISRAATKTVVEEEKPALMEKRSDQKRLDRGHQSDQTMEQRSLEHTATYEDQEASTPAVHQLPAAKEVEDDESSSDEIPPIKRSWTIQRKPSVTFSLDETTEKEDEQDLDISRSSVSVRSHLIGYNRPEVFDPPSGDNSYRSQRSCYSPRKPRGSMVAQAVNRFQPTQTDRNESIVSTADSIDSTRQFVVVTDPKEEHRQIDLDEKEEDVTDTAESYDDNAKVATTDTAITTKLQGFTRRFWKPKESTELQVEEQDEKQEETSEGEADKTPEEVADDDSGSMVEVESDIESLQDKDKYIAPPVTQEHATHPNPTTNFEVEANEPELIEMTRQEEEEAAKEEEAIQEDEILEIIPVERKITKRLIMLVTLYSGNREIMPKQKRAIAMLETCQIPPKIVDGSDPGNKQVRNDLFEIADMRGVYPLFFIEERDEADVRASPNVTFFGTFETIEKLKEEQTLGDILKFQCR